MANGYSIELSGGLLDGTDVERSLPETIANASGYDFEEYWHRLEIAAAVGAVPGTEELNIDVLDNARVLIVLGGEGVTVTLGATGEENPCDPFFVTCAETGGIGHASVTLTNNSTSERKVTIIALAYKT